MEKPNRPSYDIRHIQPGDNAVVASIIRQVMTECGAVHEGSSIFDPFLDDLYAHYGSGGRYGNGNQKKSAFYVLVVDDGTVCGCAGVAPLLGSEADNAICELQKMYLLPQARGQGLGAALLRKCLDQAKLLGYQQCYLESLESMKKAARLYKQFGFQKTCAQIGNTGHCCNTQYILALKEYP